MDEYREIIDVNPVLLYTEDLRELERVIKVDFACEGDDFEVIADIGPKRMSASSVNALVAQNPTGDINSLTIRARSRRHTPEIDAGVSLTFHRKFANYQLHADSETLFYGKRGQLNAFLQSRRPWYGKALAFFPFVLPNFTLLSLAGALVFAVRQDWLSTFLLGLTSGLLGWVSVGTFKGKLFPYVRIIFGDRPAIPSRLELGLAALNVIVVLCTIARILLAFAGK
jgi:hypothetical protein